MQQRDKIANEYRDSDGYWIELKRGWILSGERTHAIVEDTKRRAHDKLFEVVPCKDQCCR